MSGFPIGFSWYESEAFVVSMVLQVTARAVVESTRLCGVLGLLPCQPISNRTNPILFTNRDRAETIRLPVTPSSIQSSLFLQSRHDDIGGARRTLRQSQRVAIAMYVTKTIVDGLCFGLTSAKICQRVTSTVFALASDSSDFAADRTVHKASMIRLTV